MLPVVNWEAKRSFSKQSIKIKNNFNQLMLEDRLDHLSMFSKENDFTKSLSYKKVTKYHAAKNVRE